MCEAAILIGEKNWLSTPNISELAYNNNKDYTVLAKVVAQVQILNKIQNLKSSKQ